MGKGKRYSGEQKLNYKKVFAVIIAIVVITMGAIIIAKLVENARQATVSSREYYALYSENKWGILDSTGNIVINPMYEEMLIVVDKTKPVFLCVYDVNIETGEYSTQVLNEKNEQIYTDYDKVEALENYDSSGNVWYEENILRVEKDGKYGIIDLDGKVIASIQYDNIETLKGVTNSLIVEQNGKYGLINNSGVTIIEANYKEIQKFGEKYQQGYITINDDNLYGLVSYTGTQILENKYENILQIYGENYFVIEEDGAQKVINAEGDIIIEEGYDEITQIASSGVVFMQDDKYGLIGFDNEVKIEAEYDSLKEINTGYFVAEQGGKLGLIDLTGTVNIEFEYENIYFNEDANVYVAEDDEYNSSIIDGNFDVRLTGILNEINAQNQYIKIRTEDNEYKYYNYNFEEQEVQNVLQNNTLYVSKQDGKYGYVDKDGNVVVDYIYDEALEQNSYGYAAVKLDGVWGSINSEGEVVTQPQYNLDNNLIIDFIGEWHLGQDLNMNYYCKE